MPLQQFFYYQIKSALLHVIHPGCEGEKSNPGAAKARIVLTKKNNMYIFNIVSIFCKKREYTKQPNPYKDLSNRI